MDTLKNENTLNLVPKTARTLHCHILKAEYENMSDLKQIFTKV